MQMSKKKLFWTFRP